MSKDVECPYCGKWQEINHDDGYGYDEGEDYEQQCADCEKTFVYHTSISFYYEANTAECLNGGEHKYEKIFTVPRRYTKMYCTDCGYRRNPTKAEMDKILMGER